MATSKPASVEHPRRIHSFVLRDTRLTSGQQAALERLWPRYGIDISHDPVGTAPGSAQPSPLHDLDTLFGRSAPRVLEIGFGNGDSLVQMAHQQPDIDFIGIEVHRPGVGHCLQGIDRLQLGNLKVIRHDAVAILSHHIPAHALHGVQLYFPDPWHKRKHHKRRIVQPAFIKLLHSRLHSGGYLHMATDWEHYAQHMLKVMSAAQGWRNCSQRADGFVPRPESRPETKFERRGHRLNHGVWDLVFERL